MRKLVVLKLDGDLETGARVTLEIGQEGERPNTEVTGELPPNSDLEKAINQWQSTYRSFGNSDRIKAKKIAYGGSITEWCENCHKTAADLRKHLNNWLMSESFRSLREKWLQHLKLSDEVRVLIRTSSRRLRQLPWHLWDLVEDYPLAEVAYCAPECFQPTSLSRPTNRERVRILAILGNSTGIDVHKDRQLLENLPNAATTFLVEPQRQDINEQLWDQPWDILFFAGHSKTEHETGLIYINQTERLTIAELKYALRKAVANGLQLAIFNSCDGLGLASELQQLHIGQMIVMREPIPDLAAQEFLKHFLSAYVGGKSFYLAVREARERLQGLESSFPCASWLPALCQNPAQVPPSWEELLNPKAVSTDVPQPIPSKPWWSNWQSVLLVSVISTCLVMGMRSLGLLQSWELQAFDQLMRQRPDEGPDKRLLLVTITEEDVQSQPLKERGLASLSDRSLAQLLAKLEPSQARAIGLDLYRPLPVGANYRDLATRMQKGDRFIAICKYGKFGVTPPPEVPGDRQGFNNVLLDPDDVLRRHLLAVESPSPCQSKYSFNFQLATRYLADENIYIKTPVKNYLQLDKTVFKTLEKDTGGYHNIDPRGHQILLNYRASREIAPSVTLKEVLNPQFNPDLVKNRIVLIGTTAQSFNDHRWHTPYSGGQSSNPTMTGVEIQAHMVSQILSAVLDNRPLIWWWSKPGEAVWIWCWSLVGGLLAWCFESPLRLVLGAGVTLGVLYGCCLGLLALKGGWVPLVPSALVLVVTGGSVVAYSRLQTRQQP